MIDDLNLIKKLDPGRTLDSLCAFPEQLKQIWEKTQMLVLPKEFKKAQSIVLAGMGGSALGGRTVRSLFSDRLAVPFEVVTEYDLPRFVDKETMVIIASYSGNTEESLSCLEQAKKRQAMIFAITTGGKIGEEIKKGLPGMIFEPKFNYLGYPKTALGYSLGALVGFLSKAGFIHLSNEEFESKIKDFSKIQIQNPAKKLASFLQGKIGIIISSQHLKGPAIAFRNQMNEIAHSFCLFFDLPEMNHHLIEAFANPEENKKNLGVIFLQADNYLPRNRERYQITKDILKQMAVKTFDYHLSSSDSFIQALEVVQLGGFVSCYLSFLNNQDPGPEPWIIYLKEKLTA